MKRFIRIILQGGRQRRSSSRSLRTRDSDRAVLSDFGTSSAFEPHPVSGGRRQQGFRPLLPAWDKNGKSHKDSEAGLEVLACVAAAAAAAASAYEWASCAFIDPKRKFHDIYDISANSQLLGTGSFGAVCSAVHKTTGEIVAVKKIPRAQGVSFEDVAWEVEVLKVAGEHRNVTQFYDVFQDGDFYYLTMELARGGELFDLLIEQGPPSEMQAAVLMKSLIGAMAFIHMHGIIHGDIKPENVFLTKGRLGEVDWHDVRLGDFGSAVEVALGGRTTLSGLRTRGTVAYNPPESLRRMLNKKDVVLTPRSDVWSLGVVLFMLLTGEHPFSMDMSVSDEEMAQSVIEESNKTPFPDEREDYAEASVDQQEEWAMRNFVSPGARDLIKRMLEKDPNKRATADELLMHPWLQQPTYTDDAIPGNADKAIFEGWEGKSRDWHTREEAPHVTSEVLQSFWSARRKVKALVLAVVSGLVDGVLPDIAEEGEHSGRRLRDAVRARSSERGAGDKGEKGGKQGYWPWHEPRRENHPGAVSAAYKGETQGGEGVSLGPGSPTSPASFPLQRNSRSNTLGLASLIPTNIVGAAASHDAEVEADAEAAIIAAVEAKRTKKRKDLVAAKKRVADATAAAIALTNGGLAETIAAATRVSVTTSIVEELEKELRRPMEEVLAEEAGNTSKKKHRPAYPIGSREAACAVIDREKKGFITAEDISFVANLLGESVSHAEIEEMMAAMDGDPSTESERVDYDELARVIPPLCPPIPFGVGNKLYREGDKDPSFYLLTKGVVEFSVSVLQGKAPLQRQGPGASFGEVELLRADGSTAPRLASCKCVGEDGHEGEGCEVLVVTGHMFELLTDVFYGIRMKLVDQAESRLMQLAGSVLVNALKGKERSMMGLDVIWGEKEYTFSWNSVAPSRKKRTTPRFPAAADIFSKALAVSPPSPSTAPSSLSGGAVEGGSSADAARAITVETAKDVGAVALASGSRSTILSGPVADAAGGDNRAFTSELQEENGAAAASNNEGSFVLLVLEGSVTAVYGGETVEGEDDNGGAMCSPTRERVLEPGDFCFCGEGFGQNAPESPTLVTCKLWQRARVRRVPAAEFMQLMSKETMEALTDFMYSEA